MYIASGTAAGVSVVLSLEAFGVGCELASVHGLMSSDGRGGLALAFDFVVLEPLDSVCVVDGGFLASVSLSAAVELLPRTCWDRGGRGIDC